MQPLDYTAGTAYFHPEMASETVSGNGIGIQVEGAKPTRKWPFRAFIGLLILDAAVSGVMAAGIFPGYVR